MYQRFFFITVLCLGSLNIFAQNPDSTMLSLQECIELAIENNLSVKQSNLAMERSGVYLNQSKTDLLPTVSGNISQGINKGRNIDPFTNTYLNQEINYTNLNVGGNIVLFNGFSLWNSIKQNLYAFQASKMELEQQKENIALNVILAYLQILNNEELLKQSQNQAAISAEQLKRLEILDEQGAISPIQLSDLKGQLTNDQLSIINSKNALEAAKISLAEYLNMPYNSNLQLEQLSAEQLSAVYSSTPDQIYDLAVSQLASVKANALRTKSAEKGVRRAQGFLYPRLTFSSNLSTNYSNAATRNIFIDNQSVTTNDYVMVNGSPAYVVTNQSNYRQEKISFKDQLKNNYGTGFTFGLQIPVFSGWQTRNQISLAKIELKNAQYVEENNNIQLKQTIERAYLNMLTAHQRYQTLLQQVNAYTESFKAVEVKFNAGVGNSVDYMIAKNNLDQANINLISVRYDYILRIKILDYYQGRQLW
jgi:outer membrane protein